MRYFLITYLGKPNGQIDEQVSYAKRLRDSDLSTVNVILDYREQKLVKCVVQGQRVDTDFERMNDYYSKVYPEIIQQLIENNRAEGRAAKKDVI
jgi:hypothetical protein